LRLCGLLRLLADRAMLVVLDNCEHVLQATASLVVALLERCRGVRILATRRSATRFVHGFVHETLRDRARQGRRRGSVWTAVPR
jgi:predicted ATPase